MLELKKAKPLISRSVEDLNSLFSVLVFKNSNAEQGLNVQMDMETKTVYFEMTSGDETVLTVFDPSQAVALGMWLAEAGHILNFAKSINLSLTEEETTHE